MGQVVLRVPKTGGMWFEKPPKNGMGRFKDPKKSPGHVDLKAKKKKPLDKSF